MNADTPAARVPQPMRPRKISSLPLVIRVGITILLIKVFVAILFEYRWYFPPDYDASAFLGGRRHTFSGLYSVAFFVHILSGPTALLLACFLRLSGGQQGSTHWHRWAGRLLFAVVLLLLFPSGLIMARHAYAGPPAILGFGLLALFTAGATSMAAYSARSKNFQSHRRWAERSCVLLVSPLLLRLMSGGFLVLNIDSVWTHQLNAWLSWLLPLAIYEYRSSERTFVALLRPAPKSECSPVVMSNALAASLRHSSPAAKRGFTVQELVVVMILLIIVAALLLPNVRTAREAARRMQCSNNLKQLSLAILNYESANNCLPSAMAGTDGNGNPLLGNAQRLSGFVSLLPYLEQQKAWDTIAAQLEVDGVQYPPMGPAPWIEAYPPWQSKFSVLWCPSSLVAETIIPPTHYAFCIGDVSEQLHAPGTTRGAFGCRLYTKLADITDGTSRTIALSEIGNRQDRRVIGQLAINQPAGLLSNPSLCLQTASGPKYISDVPLSSTGRGARWNDGAAPHGLVATILPPNSPSCAVGGSEAVNGIYSGGSLHSRGQHVTMVDGSVQFISEEIDAGSATSPPPAAVQFSRQSTASPFGVWGALGTAAAHEPD